MAKRHDFSYFFHEGLSNMFSHGFMSFASVTIIMACLIIMGSFSLLSVNIDALIKDLENENEMVAYVDESIEDEAEAAALQSSIEAVPNVASAQFVSRTEAMDNFMSQYDSDFSVGIDEDVFRHRFVIQLSDIALMSETKADLEAVDGIAKVLAHLEYADFFVTVRNIVSVVSLVLIVILVFVSVFIMSNTIKLATFGRREEIAIMKMVGATNGFIRWPFVYEGFMLGLLGAVIAFFLQWALYAAVARGVDSNDTLQLIQVMPFSELWAPVAAVFALAGIVIGVGGSLSAIRKFLQV